MARTSREPPPSSTFACWLRQDLQCSPSMVGDMARAAGQWKRVPGMMTTISSVRSISLRNQPDINPEMIVALGLSTGAMDALRASADGIQLSVSLPMVRLRRRLGILPLSMVNYSRGPFALSADWLSMRSIELLSGLAEPPSLVSIVGNIKVPVLLIASNNPGELTEDQAYCDQIGRNAVLWYVPDAGHIEA